jgi:hypothetical protein
MGKHGNGAPPDSKPSPGQGGDHQSGSVKTGDTAQGGKDN